MKVLLVGNTAYEARPLAASLRAKGYAVVMLADTSRVMSLLDSGEYKVLLLDDHLHGIPPRALAADFHRSFPHVAIVLMSKVDLDEAGIAANTAAGISAYVVKNMEGNAFANAFHALAPTLFRTPQSTQA